MISSQSMLLLCVLLIAVAGESRDGAVCNSLSGPFCAHTNTMASYASYMTPIDLDDVRRQQASQTPTATRSATNIFSVGVALSSALNAQEKSCFFQHYPRQWMDAGGNQNDLMQQRVKTIDECEKLCCEHPQCQSFTFWMGHTCFLRANKNSIPRENSQSFSAIRIT